MFDVYTLMRPTKYYHYRTAFARNTIITHERTAQTINTIESKWAKQCNGYVDNHTTYKFESGLQDGLTFYVTCSDSKYYVGLTVEEGAW